MVSKDGSLGALVNHTSWAIQRRVIAALFLREMLTRYGRNNIGFLWLFVEPVLFTGVVVLIRSGASPFYKAAIPTVAFALTGWPSMMLWRNMPGRLIGAVKSNQALLHHRQVKVLDIYITRILLEDMATTTSLIILTILFFWTGWLTLPEDILEVTAGWLLLGWFGGGLALVLGSLSERFELVKHFWRPLSYMLMPLSGIAFVVDVLPPHLQKIALWLPMLSALEFLRDGWFGSKFHAHYDVGYVIFFNICLTFAGLSLTKQVSMRNLDEE